jgi:hypothetical protein
MQILSYQILTAQLNILFLILSITFGFVSLEIYLTKQSAKL